MANIYVRSTDGSDADNGSTWALAKATLAGAAAIDAAGDVIYISQNHSESTAAAIALNFAGTSASPTKIICVDDTGDPAPPTAVATTGTVTTTGNSDIQINGTVYVYGLTFSLGSGANSPTLWTDFSVATTSTVFDTCKFRIPATGTGARLRFGGDVLLRNSSVRFGNASQGIALGNNSQLTLVGCSIESGGTSPTTLFRFPVNQAKSVRCFGCDFTNASSTINFFEAYDFSASRHLLVNCKLPASWSGSLVTGTVAHGKRYEMYNCDSGDTNYRIQVQDYAGTITQETTIVRTGGASDGTTTISWKLVSTANAEYPHITLDTPEIVRWQESVGSSITVTVETITDNVTLTDGECWLEVQYLGTSGFPLGSFISDAKANVLATAANQTTSSETWTTTGLTTPVKQKLSVTFTPQEKGFIHAVVKLARASTTVYVDPELTVT